MLTRSPTLRSVIAAMAFVLVAFGLSLFVWKKFGGGTPLQPKGYRVTILFTQAQNLLPNADVRVSGVTIGKVMSVTPGEAATKAVVQIQPRYAPLHRDVRAIVRVKTLLGESFVALTPGSAAAPTIPENGTLARANVRRPQLLDEVLSAFDPKTRAEFTQLLEGSAEAVRGHGRDLNTALGHLGPTTEQLDQLLQTLDTQGDDVARLISGSATTFAAIDRDPARLRALIHDGRTLVDTTYRYRAGLRATIGGLPELERQLRLTSDEVAGAATDVAPTIHALLGVRDRIAPALIGGTDLATETDRLLERLEPTFLAARAGLGPGTRLLRAVPPLLTQLYASGRNLVPLLQLVGRYKREVVGGLADYADSGEATAPDSSGNPRHYLRGINIVNNEVYQLYGQRPGTNRHNAYPPPGWLNELGHGGLRSADCRNASNTTPPAEPGSIPAYAETFVPAFGSAPACATEPPWTFKHLTRSYPHLKRAR